MQFFTFLHSLSYFFAIILPLYGLWNFLAAAEEENKTQYRNKPEVL